MSSGEIIPSDATSSANSATIAYEEETTTTTIPQVVPIGNLKEFTYHITNTSSRPEDSDDDDDDDETKRTLSFTGFDMTGESDLRAIQKCTGETLWPCSRLLADYLQYDYDWKQRQQHQVLELGCGLGLCGTVASVALGKSSSTSSSSSWH
jgi:hypothetical protein